MSPIGENLTSSMGQGSDVLQSNLSNLLFAFGNSLWRRHFLSLSKRKILLSQHVISSLSQEISYYKRPRKQMFTLSFLWSDRVFSWKSSSLWEKKNGINTEIKQTGDFCTPTSSSCRNSSSWSHFSAESAPAGLRNRNIPVWTIYVCAWRRAQEAAGPVHR